MARERWQDNEKVKAAWENILDRFSETGWTAYSSDGRFAPETPQHALNALCEAVAACVDASPSETTGGPAAWQVVDASGYIVRTVGYSYNEDAAEIECREWCAKLNDTPLMETHIERPCTVRPLYSAPPAGDGVPRVTEEVRDFLQTCAEGWDHDEGDEMHNAHNSACRVCHAKRILEALSYCATRQGGVNG